MRRRSPHLLRLIAVIAVDGGGCDVLRQVPRAEHEAEVARLLRAAEATVSAVTDRLLRLSFLLRLLLLLLLLLLLRLLRLMRLRVAPARLPHMAAAASTP